MATPAPPDVPGGPVDSGLWLEVRRFVTEAGRRRTLPARAYVGTPGGTSLELAWPAPRRRGPHAPTRPDLRADLAERAVDGLASTEHVRAWVTRSGGLDPTDDDLVWYHAARTGLARHGLELPAFYVLDRTGWYDVVSGRRRTWSRLRPIPEGATLRGPLTGRSPR